MPLIFPEARRWAVKELARRAGVTTEFFNSWTIEIRHDATIIHLQPGSNRQIHFRNLGTEHSAGLAGPQFHTAHAAWMVPPGESLKNAIPDLVVPFCEAHENGGHPLFQRSSTNRIDCFFDLPAATLFCLSRVEETQHPRRDVHLRFTSEMSVARRDGFLDRPIVDEWGLAFAQALEVLVPGWHQPERVLRTIVSHDIDDVGTCSCILPDHVPSRPRAFVRTAWMSMPFDVRHAIRLSLQRHPARGALHLMRTLACRQPSLLHLVQTMVHASVLRGLHSAVYWKASRLGPFDSGYDPRHDAIRSLISQLRDQGVEHGLHAGYNTFRSPQELEEEVQLLRTVLRETRFGARQHYLRWCPDTWIDLENCGLAHDATLGYADYVGFRAGTCVPYHPWLWLLNREARLLEIPLVAMDTTLLEYMDLHGDELLSVIRPYIEKCRVVGGVFTFLCHNTTLRDPDFAVQYTRLLDVLAFTESFDWRPPISTDFARASEIAA